MNSVQFSTLKKQIHTDINTNIQSSLRKGVLYNKWHKAKQTHKLIAKNRHPYRSEEGCLLGLKKKVLFICIICIFLCDSENIS